MLLLLISLHLLLSGCSIIATSGAELTGVALLHDRRSSDIIVNDGVIELKALAQLNAQKEIFKACHFNITAYNNAVLVTGEVPTEILRAQLINTLKNISHIKHIYDELIIAEPTSYSSRIQDTYITIKVKYALSNIDNLPGFDATRVKVITENKTVYLLGVLHKGEANIVAETTRKVGGVQQVVKIFDYINY